MQHGVTSTNDNSLIRVKLSCGGECDVRTLTPSEKSHIKCISHFSEDNIGSQMLFFEYVVRASIVLVHDALPRDPSSGQIVTPTWNGKHGVWMISLDYFNAITDDDITNILSVQGEIPQGLLYLPSQIKIEFPYRLAPRSVLPVSSKIAEIQLTCKETAPDTLSNQLVTLAKEEGLRRYRGISG